ncbi:hypothetical protein QP445_13090, partial [Micrococcus luteus]|nr:hypothetical protein [Micrococcus luteus]
GLVTGRLTFVLIWWSDYIAAPWSILAVGDGGFYPAAGVPVAVAWIWWRTRHEQSLRKPVYAGVLAGLMAWGEQAVRWPCCMSLLRRYLRLN